MTASLKFTKRLSALPTETEVQEVIRSGIDRNDRIADIHETAVGTAD